MQAGFECAQNMYSFLFAPGGLRATGRGSLLGSPLFVCGNGCLISVASGDKDAVRRAQKSKRVQELSSPKQSPIHLAQTCFIANGRPFVFDRSDLVVDDGNRCFRPEQKGRCSGHACGDLAPAITAVNEHGLRSLLTCARLRANVIGRCQRQLMTVPEC